MLQRFLQKLHLSLGEIVVKAALGDIARHQQLRQAKAIIALLGKQALRFPQNQVFFIHILIIDLPLWDVKFDCAIFIAVSTRKRPA